MNTDTKTSWTINQLAIIREEVLRVIDDGCTCESGEKHPWEFYEDSDADQMVNIDPYTEDMANANRLRFVDEVQCRLMERSK